jgi:zinc protease
VRARRRAFATVVADAAGAGDLADELAFVASKRLPIGYLDQLAGAVARLGVDDVRALVERDLAEARMVVVASGRAPVLDAAFAAAGVTPQVLVAD